MSWRLMISGGLTFVLTGALSGAVLNLVEGFPPGADPVADGYHVDGYSFPRSLLDPAKPMSRLSISYDASASAGGGHPMMNLNPGGLPTPVWTPILGSGASNDTHLLFDPSQVSGVTGVIESAALFEATVDFLMPVTEVSGDIAFHAVHGAPYDLTELRWTATYFDGSSATFVDGIIPEPGTGLMLSLAVVLTSLGRRARPFRVRAG